VRDTVSETDRERVRTAIAAAEAGTSGEIYAVVARQSDDYAVIPIVWATLAALVAPAPLLLMTNLAASVIYAVQLGVFVVLAVVLSIPAIKPLVIPEVVRRRRTRAMAVEMFLAHGLHTTEARTGVLIFVSLAERRAEIVADSGIAVRVEQATWDHAMAQLIAEIRAGRLGDGLVAAIGATGEELARHFPPHPRNRDELPNELVIL
jgi:putative membrane protein